MGNKLGRITKEKIRVVTKHICSTSFALQKCRLKPEWLRFKNLVRSSSQEDVEQLEFKMMQPLWKTEHPFPTYFYHIIQLSHSFILNQEKWIHIFPPTPK